MGQSPVLKTSCRISVNVHESLDTGAICPVITVVIFTDYLGPLTPAMHGLVMSIVLLSAAVASLFGGFVSDTLGRKSAAAIGSHIFSVGAAFEAGVSNLIMFITGRLIMGVGEEDFWRLL